jgi:hypothetical protein
LLFAPSSEGETPSSTEQALGRPAEAGCEEREDVIMSNKVVKKLAADRASKATSESMAARGKLIAGVAPQSTLWQNNATIKQSGLDAIAAAAAVEADDATIAQLQIQMDAAKNQKGEHQVVCGSKFDVYFTHVEDIADTAKEMQDLGVDPLVEHTYSIAAPLGLTARSNLALHDVAARVKRAPGMERCIIEISADLTMATGVKAFPGDGARQTMGPFPPGTYALRACHIRASERSAYTEIVNVVVK